MVKQRLEKLVFTGLGCTLGLAFVLSVTHMAIADPPADATYKGSKACLMCHKMTHADLVAAFQKTAHPRALQTPDQPGAIVATFDANSPVKKDDIAYVLGVGDRQQAYIGKDGKTLPGLWNSVDKKWETQAVVDATTNCIPCHVTGFDVDKKTYSEPGVWCEACHGPGSAHAATADKTKIGQMTKLTPVQQANVCARCHSRGVSKTGDYPFAVGYKWGDDITKYVTLSEVKGPARNQQYNEWITSKHAQNGVGCTTCHDVHGKGSSNEFQLKKPMNELCLTCHAADVTKAGHPKITDALKCAMCHMPSGMHTWVVPGK